MPKVIDLPTATSMSDSDYLIMESSGGGTKKITRANALNRSSMIWQYFKDNPGQDTVITNSAEQAILTTTSNITFLPGKYLLFFNVSPLVCNIAGGTGNFYLYIGNTLVDTRTSYAHVVLNGSASMIFQFTVSAQTTGLVSVKLKSGSANKTFTVPQYANALMFAWEV